MFLGPLQTYYTTEIMSTASNSDSSHAQPARIVGGDISWGTPVYKKENNNSELLYIPFTPVGFEYQPASVNQTDFQASSSTYLSNYANRYTITVFKAKISSTPLSFRNGAARSTSVSGHISQETTYQKPARISVRKGQPFCSAEYTSQPDTPVTVLLP